MVLRGVVLAAVLSTTAQPSMVGLRSQSSNEASAIGTLSKYEARTLVLTIKTAKDIETFVLADKASVHLGSRAIPEAEIGSHVGSRVKVRFSESGRKRVATSVMLSPKT